MNVQKKNYDSAFCGSLPLHHLNVVQPHGVLMVLCKDDKEILQVSENILGFLGIEAQDIVNTHFSQYTDAESFDLLNKRFIKDISGKLPLNLSLHYQDKKLETLCLAHVKKELLILEFFPAARAGTGEPSFIDIFQQLKYVIAALDAAQNIQELCTTAAHELKQLSGFDKVLIYRFDADWNGSVMAEVKEDGMESYSGLTFPASDIPKQARQMYMKNPYRLIPNRVYDPVKIYPVINPLTSAFLDISDCDIRGVASVHLEYMKNMQVDASMSTRILLDEDHLWGLISCHHRLPMYLDYEICSMFELVSSSISAKVALLTQKEQFTQYAALQELLSKLISQVYAENNLVKGLLGHEPNLLQLVNAGGVVISINKSIDTAGEVPGRNNIKDLILWLQSQDLPGIYKQESISGVFENAISYADIGSGILAIPVNSVKGDFIIFFRPEVVQEVEWGGNPNEAIRFEKNSVNYHPRNSFQVWQQVVKYTSLPWKNYELSIAEQFRYFLLEHLMTSSTGARQL